MIHNEDMISAISIYLRGIETPKLLVLEQKYQDRLTQNLVSTTTRAHPFAFGDSQEYLRGFKELIKKLHGKGFIASREDFDSFLYYEQKREEEDESRPERERIAIRLLILAWMSKIVAYPLRFEILGKPEYQEEQEKYQLDEIVKYYFIVSEFGYIDYRGVNQHIQSTDDEKISFLKNDSPHEDTEKVKLTGIFMVYHFLTEDHRKILASALHEHVKEFPEDKREELYEKLSIPADFFTQLRDAVH